MDAKAFFLLLGTNGNVYTATVYNDDSRLVAYTKNGATCREDDIPPPLVRRLENAYTGGARYGTL